MDQSSFSPLAQELLKALIQDPSFKSGGKIKVNPLVSKVASWYEKLRNVMEFRESEVVLRAAIERILKRRIILGGDGGKIAEPLVRELVWATYFPDNSIPEEVVSDLAEKIDLHLQLRRELIKQYRMQDSVATGWMYHLLSSVIAYKLSPQKERETMSNFMFQVMNQNVRIIDDTDENRDIQVFIATRKNFNKDDLAFLRYHLFTQFFGELTKESFETTVKNFPTGYKKIEEHLHYPRKDRIGGYVKSKTGAFFILEDLLRFYKGDIQELYKDEAAFAKVVFDTCEARYNGIAARVRTALVRSIFFLIITKAFFALFVEGTFEQLVYGSISWTAIAINTLIPPFLMIIAGFMLQPPGRDNSKRIRALLKTILSEDPPQFDNPLVIRKVRERKNQFLTFIFTLLWLMTFVLSFGAVVFILAKLNFSVVSQSIFLFFFTIVSFLTYRIGLMSNVYTVDAKEGWASPVLDFFFMPIVRVGRHLTEGIAQINVILFFFDFVIETPFKGIFSFFEQLFFFLKTKREDLG